MDVLAKQQQFINNCLPYLQLKKLTLMRCRCGFSLLFFVGFATLRRSKLMQKWHRFLAATPCKAAAFQL